MRNTRNNGPEQEVVSTTIDVLRPGWRRRAGTQRSWSAYLESVAAMCLSTWLWIWPAQLVAGAAHTYFYSAEAKFHSPLDPSLSIWVILPIIPIWFPLFCLCGIAINSIQWLIPFTRHRAERIAEELPELSISNANRELCKLLGWSSLIAVPLFLLGVTTHWTKMAA
ncbi:MAG: hypothetical protein ACKOQM_00745 [Novosphingobium sp.]